MNEAQTEFELIEPKLKDSGWGIISGSKIHKQFKINLGRIQSGNYRLAPLKADYVLEYNSRKLAVIEAKSDELQATEGVMQAKNYAKKLNIGIAFSTNGKQIYQICMETGKENFVDRFPTPQELWEKIEIKKNLWANKFNEISYDGKYQNRFYQEIAVNKVLDAIANEKTRILLTLATGTGKTNIASQISWKLFQAKWTLQKDEARKPRILFLTDRNFLANQAFNEFSVFQEDSKIIITTNEIRKKGKLPTNGNIFFTIFQTFMSGPNNSPYFGEYPKDFFDFIIIDECHRGGANDESSWRDILEYFSPAVQLGLTATPKRDQNIDTYKYFGEPVFVYSLKEGIEDGFLTPFKIRKIKSSIDEYIYSPEDEVLEGEVENNKIYEEKDFNKIIEIKERELNRVKTFMDEINQKEKTIVFCANQGHALLIRDLINQVKKSNSIDYCVRVTAYDGNLGEQFLKDFQDNEKNIPTILTTSQKLSTGVDARNIRNIILLRPINSIIEFKQIIGRGTRIFEGKNFFTIYDFVDAYKHFCDPEWDGEPLEPIIKEHSKTKLKEPNLQNYSADESDNISKKVKIKLKLREGKEEEIQCIIESLFFDKNGNLITAQQFLENFYGDLPKILKNELELRQIWAKPTTRKVLLNTLKEAGYDIENLKKLQNLINAQNSDIFDVLEYINSSFKVKPISRKDRVEKTKDYIFQTLNEKQKKFLEFVLKNYIKDGFEELDQEKLPNLLEIQYHSLLDAKKELGNLENIKNIFIGFQKHLYNENHLNI